MNTIIVTFANTSIFNNFTSSAEDGLSIYEAMEKIAEQHNVDVRCMVEGLVACDGADLTAANETYINRLLDSDAYNNLELKFDDDVANAFAEAEDDDEEFVDDDEEFVDDDDDDDDVVADPTPGLVLVRTGGGINTVTIDIMSGVTTVADAIATGKVIRSSGMTLDQLKAGVKSLNGNPISSWEACNVITLNDGDTLDIAPQAAHCKGSF